GARPPEPAARRRPGDRDAWTRNLDHRRPDAAARALAADAGAGCRVLALAGDAAAHRRAGRLVGRRRDVHGSESPEWGRDHLLPAEPASLRAHQPRGPRRAREPGRYDSAVEAPGHQPRIVDDAGEAAPRASRGNGGIRRVARA